MRRATKCLHSFCRNEDGSIAVEAVIILPVIFWTYLALFAIFDSYRSYATAQKAAYTISDMISRETNPLNASYIDGTREMLRYLSNSAHDDTAIRITSVKYNGNTKLYESDWSQTRGWMPELTTEDVKNWHNRLPVMPDNERIVVVETWIKYDPPFDTGLSNREIRHFVFTKPRYAPKVLWDSGGV